MADSSVSETTELLRGWTHNQALDDLFSKVYRELGRLAGRWQQGERTGKPYRSRTWFKRRRRVADKRGGRAEGIDFAQAPNVS